MSNLFGQNNQNQAFGQPPAKQPFAPSTGGGGAPSFALSPTDLEPPDEPEVEGQHEPDEVARMHFLIHCNKMLTSFAKAFRSCPSTQTARLFLENTFPRLPSKIDNNTHAEMNYTLSEKQKEVVDGWIKQFYQVMTHKVTFQGREFQVSQYFQHRKKEGWGFVIKHVKMIGMLHLEKKWATMTQGSQNSMWRYMDLLYRDSKQFMGFKNLENLIPKEMRSQLEGMMAKNGGPSPDNPMGISQEDAQNFLTNMKPEMMQGFISKVFSSPEQTQKIMQSVTDVAGQDMGQLTGFMQNIFKPT